MGYEKPMTIPSDDTSIPERMQGKIIKLSKDGWGFISSKEIKFTRIFFHWTSLVQDTLNFQQLKLGMTVEFTPNQEQHRGWRAFKVKVVNNESDQKPVVGDMGPAKENRTDK
jgi:hypothetical protein